MGFKSTVEYYSGFGPGGKGGKNPWRVKFAGDDVKPSPRSEARGEGGRVSAGRGVAHLVESTRFQF
jgi:hypothetical protein